MNHRIPVLLDGDPGHDDAIAWMLAATGLDIRGVSSAAGNQTIEKRRATPCASARCSASKRRWRSSGIQRARRA